MLKKIVSVIAITGLIAGTLAGCGSSEPAASTDGTTLELWSWSPIQRTADKMIAAFEEENPDIQVNFSMYNYNPEYLEAIQAATGSGNLPDIMALHPGSDCQNYKDYLLDLGAYASETWGDDWTSNYEPVTESQLQMGNEEGDDAYRIIPIETQDIYIEYNKALFDSLGLKAPTTYDELVAAAKTLRDNDLAPLFFGGADGWQHVNLLIMCTSQIDKGLFDACQNGEKAWTDADMIQALENYKKLFDDGVMQDNCLSSTSYSDGTTLFLAGKVGMMALGSWWPQEFTSEDDVTDTVANWDYDYFYLPAISKGADASAPIGGVDFGYGITNTCENPDAAWAAVASFAAGVGAQRIADEMNNHLSWPGIVPDPAAMSETVGARAGVDNAVAEFTKSGKDIEGGLVNQRIAAPTIETAIQEAMQGLVAGDYTPEQAAKHIQEAQDAL